MNENTINTGNHYHKIKITENLVGENLDPALIATLYDLDPLLLQALKKILMAGKRGLKNREDDLIGALSSIDRQLKIDKLFLEKEKEKPFEFLKKETDYLNTLDISLYPEFEKDKEINSEPSFLVEEFVKLIEKLLND